jgi:hypothetical protein
VLLAENEAPRGFNAYSRGEIMQVSCLNFGDKFRIIPDYSGSCDVGYGLQVDIPEQIIITENDLIIVTTYAKRIGYLYEATHEIRGGQPGGQMAVFSKWSIWIEDLFGYTSPSKLLELHVGSVT